MIGIYIITNEINNKVYVGQVGKGNNTIINRINGHYRSLIKNKHRNLHLQKSWNKYILLYGEESFTFDILEIVENKNLLDDREKYWIEYYEADNPLYGYNKTKGGEGGIPNEETKQKISNSLKGRKQPTKYIQYRKEGLKQSWKQRKNRNQSKETKQKISNTLKNRILSNEHKKNISNAQKGKHRFSEEIKLNIINDINNKIKIIDICSKYNLSYPTILKIRREILNE